MESSSERRFISVDPSKCVGCSVCEYVCALEKEWSFNPLRSRIRVVRVHPLFSMAMVCRVCDDAPCVVACPRKALKQSAENSVILVDEGLCDGCGWCIPACPYGGVMMNPEKGVVMMCDLCGGEPKCIDFCPEEALELVTEETAISLSSALEKLRLDAEKAVGLLKSGGWNKLFMEIHKIMRRLEEKLEALSEKELELQSKVTF